MVIQRRRTLTGFGGVGGESGPNIAPLESTNQISSSEDSNDGDNRGGLWEKQVSGSGFFIIPKISYNSLTELQ